MLDVERWMVAFRFLAFAESDGCLVALAVFKTVVGPFNGSRYVRFVPSPPFSSAECGMRRAERRASSFRIPHSAFRIPHSALDGSAFLSERRWLWCHANGSLD